MVVRQIRAGETVEVSGKLPQIVELQGAAYLTTTLFVKYNSQLLHQMHLDPLCSQRLHE